MDVAVNTITSHPYVVIATIVVLVLILILVYFDCGAIPRVGRSAAKTSSATGDDMDELIDSINAKQESYRGNKRAGRRSLSL